MEPDRSELEEMLVQFKEDRESLDRAYPLSLSPQRQERLTHFHSEWRAELDKVDWKDLNRQGKVDAILFANLLDGTTADLKIQESRLCRIWEQIDFLEPLIALLEDHRRLERMESHEAAARLDQSARRLAQVAAPEDPGAASRAAEAVDEVRNALKDWFEFYNGYDPMFTWWAGAPYKDLDKKLQEYVDAIKQGLDDPAELRVAPPVGRDALLADLEHEMIVYSPEELIAIGDSELAWCRDHLLRASIELGFGNDTAAALEHVKSLHEPPGGQTQLVKDLALEAIEFVTSRDLVTVPRLAAETWRMGMMSPEKQKVNPFFLGGEQIVVSYPTHEMSHDEKAMSMRGNNRHFSRATVQHELIPGHHLQGFTLDRHRPYRSIFGTCFWIEGWCLYWEMLLWDLGFPRGPEDRIGMLFWRMYRCARISFSLKYHLGEMSAQECVDLLVDTVGHERANAEGEVRRSFRGAYPPLYQAAYMIGGLQFMALRRELVESGKMTDRQFHDSILRENQMPLEVLRLVLCGAEPAKTFKPSWRFSAIG